MRRGLWVLLAVVLSGGPAGAQKVKLPRAKESLLLCDLGSDAAVAGWTGLPCEGTEVDGKPAMQFTFPKWEAGGNEWPAVYLSHDEGAGFAATNWSHYGALVLDAWTDGGTTGDLAVELRDTLAQNGYSLHFPIEPGRANRIEVSLPDVSTQVNIEHIQQIVLYTTKPKETYTVTVAALRLEPGEKPPLVEFDLVYPNYRGLVFPEARRARVTAVLQPEEYGVKPADLTLELSCRGQGKATLARQRLRGTQAAIDAPVRPLPAGALTLTATLKGADGAAVATREWPLRKLTPDEVGKLSVYIDEHNNAIVDGKPFFPLGFYGSGSASQAAEIADSPFNCLLDYGTNRKPKAEMLAYLDMLDEKGLKLVYCLNDVYPTATYYEGQSWEGVEGNEAIAEAVVKAYRDHPALLAWYLNDERPKSMAPAMREYYERIRHADPNHPCYIVLCNMAELSYFVDTTDVMGVDPYPIPQSPATRVSDWMEWANAATRGHMPTWLVPQAFAWYQHHPAGSDRARIPTEEDLRTGRAPTYEEARCMTYLALAHGAKGLIYWCYYNMRVLPQYEEMWGWMKRIGEEVKTLSPVLLSPEDLGPVASDPSPITIHTKLKRCTGRLYLIAVNAASEPCEVTFELARKLPREVGVMFEGRAVSAQGRRLTDQFKPLEVHVYDLGEGRR
jgi:hypothetical protein